MNPQNHFNREEDQRHPNNYSSHIQRGHQDSQQYNNSKPHKGYKAQFHQQRGQSNDYRQQGGNFEPRKPQMQYRQQRHPPY